MVVFCFLSVLRRCKKFGICLFSVATCAFFYFFYFFLLCSAVFFFFFSSVFVNAIILCVYHSLPVRTCNIQFPIFSFLFISEGNLIRFIQALFPGRYLKCELNSYLEPFVAFLRSIIRDSALLNHRIQRTEALSYHCA